MPPVLPPLPNLFGLLPFPQFWLAIPLALAFAFVYAGTRCEGTRFIVKRALRVGGLLFFFLILIGAILTFVV